MKKRKIIVGLASIVLIVGCCLATYRYSIQINLRSGEMREVRSSLWITIQQSPPKQTTISLALGGSIKPGKWLTVWKEDFSITRIRWNPCYPRMLFWVGAIDRTFIHPKIGAITAKMALDELEKTEDPCLLMKRLERFWNALANVSDNSWADSEVESDMSRIWKETTTEQAAPSNR